MTDVEVPVALHDQEGLCIMSLENLYFSKQRRNDPALASPVKSRLTRVIAKDPSMK